MKGATEQRERDGMKERENAMESVTKGRHDDITTKPFRGGVSWSDLRSEYIFRKSLREALGSASIYRSSVQQSFTQWRVGTYS